MDLLSGLNSGRESLMVHGTALATTADNLANSNTLAFKSNRLEFADMLSQSLGSLYSAPSITGSGVLSQGSTATHFQQGTFDVTGRELDFSIEGKGFFNLSDGTNSYYTRAGNFVADATGNIVTQEGLSLMGFTAASPDTLVPLSGANISGAATATSAVVMGGNLSTAAPIIEAAANPATFDELSGISQFSTSLKAIDGLGTEHDVILHFFHTEQLGYTVQAYVNGLDTGGTDGVPSLIGTGTITFDATGVQAADTAPALTLTPAWGNGAAAGNFTVDLSSFTGYGTSSTITSLNVDGNLPGSVLGYELNDGGALNAKLTGGGIVNIGTVVLSNFNNPDGLERAGNNNFRLTASSGDAILGAPGTVGLGTTRNGRLEQSNVDTANEFISVVRFQRGYQAGSQVITTLSDLLNQTIQLL